MHISLDSALGRQRRLNQVGETISSIAAPTAAYSLRSITGGDPKVVRVRRDSDNHEQDFTASEVSSGALVDFVNTQVTAPLDIQALTSTGRDGDFLIAKAAYSLRSLGTRQATVAATGDTVARANGKYVCQARSLTGDLKSFTADEVSDGTLVDFVLGNTASLVNSRAYFDGSSNYIAYSNGSDFSLSSNESFELSFNFVYVESSNLNRRILSVTDSSSNNNVFEIYKQPSASSSAIGIMFGGDGTAKVNTGTLTSGKEYLIKFGYDGSSFFCDLDGTTVGSSTETHSGISTAGNLVVGARHDTNQKASGVISNISFSKSGTTVFSVSGHGTTASNWTSDQSDSPTINGTLAAYTGQEMDGFVKTWYDQSVTNQAGDTATGNHATQATAANQPKIVSDGSLLTDGINFDGSNDLLSGTTISSLASGAVFYVFKSEATDEGQLFQFSNGSTYSTSATINSGSEGRLVASSDASTDSRNGPVFGATGVTTNQKHLLSLVLDSSTEVTTATVDGSSMSSGASPTGRFDANISILSIGQRGDNSFSIQNSVSEVIIYDTDQTDNRTAIEANIGEHYSISGIPAFDNSVNGFVETWYDQSANGRDAVQATASKQPLIVESGSLNVDSFSNPTIRFEKDSETHLITTDSTLDPNLEVSAFVVQKDEQVANLNSGWVSMRRSDSSGRRSAFEMGVNNNSIKFRLIYDPGVDNTNKTDTEVTVASDGLGTTSIMSGIKTSSGDLDGFFNGSSVIDTTVTDNTDLGSGYGITMGKHSNTGQFADGRLNEVIFYLSDQTANRSAIETNLANHYGITLL